MSTCRRDVSRMTSRCYTPARSVHRSPSAEALKTLIVPLVLTRLEYGSAYVSIRYASSRRVSATALLICRINEHSTMSQPFLTELHWLPAPQRISFKLATVVHRRLHGAVPSHLCDVMCPVSSLSYRGWLRSPSSGALNVQSRTGQSLANGCLPSLLLELGTRCQLMSPMLRRNPIFKRRLKTLQLSPSSSP